MSAKILVLQAKNKAIFARLTELYNTSKNITTCTDLRSTESFMADTETLGTIRNEYIFNLDSINELSIKENSVFIPDYQSLNSFEGIYTRIQRVRSQCIKSVTPSVHSSGTEHKASGTQIKLPPLDIPSFDGKIDNWSVFYESFRANIHENKGLMDSQKIQYLIGKLSGSALKITAGIIPSGENYLSIWDSLVQKYQDKRALASHYMSILFNIKPATNNSASLNTFVESFHASVSALKQLKIVNLEDFILLNMALRKIDSTTAQAFEMHMRNKEIPSYTDFIEFMKGQIKILDRTIPASSNSVRTSLCPHPNITAKHISYQPQNKDTVHKARTFLTCNNNTACLMCNKSEHQHLYYCSAFKSLPAKSRLEFIKSKRGCVNCLSLSHTASLCKSTYFCRICNKRHHSLLHLDNNDNKNNFHKASYNSQVVDDDATRLSQSLVRDKTLALGRPAACGSPPPPAQPPVSLCARAQLLDANSNSTIQTKTPRTTVLLSTAQINVSNANNKNVSVRCLIDNASQNNIITLTCCKKLNLKPISLANSFIQGIGSASQSVIGYIILQISSKSNEHSFSITALVVDKITDNIPADYVDTSVVQHLVDVPLADPLWYVPGEIELILGAQLFPFLLLNGRIISPPAPPAIETVFGYILMGNIPSDVSQCETAYNNVNTASFLTCYNDRNAHYNNLPVDDVLSKFWELEEVPTKHFMSPAEKECEELYCTTVSRDASGKYCVALPFCREPTELGESRSVAARRLGSLERKLQDSELRASYNEVIQDYIENDYLSEVPLDDPDYGKGYFIPHHPVIRQDKTTTKVRIVLDASAKCHNNVSLNDILHTGPNLQADIFILLLNFRLFKIAMTADIKQMYLRISVMKKYRKYLKMLFRFNTSEPIREFQFNCVAFGLKSSPYLAMRTVRQLAADECHRFPKPAEIASRELYMDDLATSIPSVEEAKVLSNELIELFKLGGFDLTKWASNSSELLSAVPQTNRAAIDFSDDCNLKILGIKWVPAFDVFTFSTSPIDELCTKRTILSAIARLWDVLGFAAPVVLLAKLLIKQLWIQRIDWDETPPKEIISVYQKFRQQLPLLTAVKVARHIAVYPGCTTNIVAFADASTKAYGCVIYVHVTDQEGNIHVNLVCAKSKVAPLKIVSLARLELCAAVLMSKLIKLVYDTYSARTNINNIYAFSDSKIALAWIHSSPHRWNVFVSNRVALCQENVNPKHFHHVNGNENPSDCLSRGILPEQLVSHPLWWHGPPWLHTPVSEWPITTFNPPDSEELPEMKSNTLTCTDVLETNPGVLYTLALKFSSWNKILRIIVYILRILKLLPRSDRISSSQLNVAEIYLIRDVQQYYFKQLIFDLKKGNLPAKPLRKLDPFIDERGIVRIGGRLSNSNLPYESLHPALLPKHDHITHLIIDYFHKLHCHTGANLLNSLLRQKFWIISSRTVIRQRVRACNFCFKNSPKPLSPKMADLPSFRVQETKAFVHTGVDYAGPIRVTLCRRRGQKSQKAYICIFICLVTKAVHVELATDLSTDTFISAFKRFISRRGPVSCLYSDNGTNFIGAKSQLEQLLVDRRIEWHMIPPRAPHFGGLWESNIKSLKTHLYRVIGSQLLTYEELLTVLTQIETILNSRPLCILTEDPYPEPLTPAHFIMASPLTFLPNLPVSEESISLRCRKQLLDQMVGSYWRRWHLEYLHNLQVRQKWLIDTTNIKIGTIVLIHQDDTPPLRWPMGIIKKVYPGKDGKVRVALIKTPSGLLKRPIVKLCPLPSQ